MFNDFDQQAGVAQEKNSKFHFKPAYELTAHPRPVHWLIKHYIEAGSLWQVFGAPGSWKTFVVLMMAFCYAAKITWCGNPIKKPGTVFYICGEGLDGLGRRLKALEQHYGVSLQDLHFFVSSRAASFLDKNGAAEVVAAINELVEKHGNPDLIIIDTLSRNFGPGDESKTEDMAFFVSIIDRELRDRFKCSVGVVHHSGLSASDRSRGSSALKAALDFEYSLIENPNGTRTLQCTKVKDFEPPPEISFRSDVVELSGWIDEDSGCPLTSLVLIQTTDNGRKGIVTKLKGQKSIMYQAIKDCVAEKQKEVEQEAVFDGNTIKIDFETIREMAFRLNISTKSDAAKRIAVDRALRDLQNLNLINTLDGLYWLK